MKKENGAALIVVLSLLSVSLMVGLSSMQSSQIHERLTANYRAHVDAYMVAESVAAMLLSNGMSPDSDTTDDCFDVVGYPENYGSSWVGLSDDDNKKFYISCDYEGHGQVFLVKGVVGGAVRYLLFNPGGGGESNVIKDIVEDSFFGGGSIFDYALLVGGGSQYQWRGKSGRGCKGRWGI